MTRCRECRWAGPVRLYNYVQERGETKGNTEWFDESKAPAYFNENMCWCVAPDFSGMEHHRLKIKDIDREPPFFCENGEDYFEQREVA